ncbi:MAG: hypothetical protein IKH65_05405 [Clostridia bacterium]|nr:hypothetical protein [Clostridia bacterium]
MNSKISKINEALIKNEQRIADYKEKIAELQKRNTELKAEKAAAKEEEILAFMRENGKDINDLVRAFGRKTKPLIEEEFRHDEKSDE